MDYETLVGFVPLGSEVHLELHGGRSASGTVTQVTRSALALSDGGPLILVRLDQIDYLQIVKGAEVARLPTTAAILPKLTDLPPRPAMGSEQDQGVHVVSAMSVDASMGSIESRVLPADRAASEEESSSCSQGDTGGAVAGPEHGRVEDRQDPFDAIVHKSAGGQSDVYRQLQELKGADVSAIDWTSDAVGVAAQHLCAARSGYEYAAKIHELNPKFGRIQNVHLRVNSALQTERANPSIIRILGNLELLQGRPERARPYLASAAHLGADQKAWCLQIIASARLDDEEAMLYAGVQLLRLAGIDGFGDLWEPWLEYVSARNRLAILADTLSGPLKPAERAYLVELTTGKELDEPPLPRPVSLVPRPLSQRPTHSPRAIPTSRQPSPNLVNSPRRSESISYTRSKSSVDDPYQRAHAIEHRGGDLEEAKALYRQAIKQGVKRESRIKDLAWLVRRTEGPIAALRVIEEEYPGELSQSAATDNILIDFLFGAERYKEALKIIDRQLSGTSLSYSRRGVLEHQRAMIRLRQGEDCVADWQVLAERRSDAYVRRGLALAYLMRGDTQDLDHAEEAVSNDTDAKANDIRQRIEDARLGVPGEELAPEDIASLLAGSGQALTPPLIEYVTRTYSTQATNLIEQRQREKKTVHPRDAERLAENADNLRGRQRENSADGYISAAVIVRDKLHRTGSNSDYSSYDERASDEYRSYLCQGLVSLADVMLDREHPEAARDLYSAALSVSESMPEAEEVPDVKYAYARYFLSLEGRRALGKVRGDVEKVPLRDTLLKHLAYCHQNFGDEVFALVVTLFSVSAYAGSAVLAVINDEPELEEAAHKYISGRRIDLEFGGREDSSRLDTRTPAAWTLLARARLQQERNVVRAVMNLMNTELTEESLQSALASLHEAMAAGSVWTSPHMDVLGTACRELRRSLDERSFEERETCYRRTMDLTQGVLDEIRLAPTQFEVEALGPVAEKLKGLAATANMDLIAVYPPEPTLSLALETVGTDSQGSSILQIKIANQAGRAPLESPELRVAEDPTIYRCEQSEITLPSAVRGGEHKIEVVKLAVTDEGHAQGAFSVPFTLRYRARGSAQSHKYLMTLPVQLSASGDFEEVSNPYEEGSLGRPVAKPKMFFGREDLLDRIVNRLKASEGGGTGFAIYGQKRAGKSSIRLRLAERLARLPGVIVADIGNVSTMTPVEGAGSRDFLQSFSWQILKRANKALSDQGRDPIGADDDLRRAMFASVTPIIDLLDSFDSYRSRAAGGVGTRFVLLFDEFQYLELWIRQGLLHPSFMQSMKAMIERGILDIVIVGQDALDRLITQHANVFAVFARERVSYLESDSARKLINDPIKIGGEEGESRYREGALERILELTGGSAFYIQKFCYDLVVHMNSHRAPFVTEADVDIVHRSLLVRLDAKDFNNLETSGYLEEERDYSGGNAIGPDYYRRVLVALAVASREGPVTIDKIRSYYRGPDDLDVVLNDLVGRDVVRKERGLYQIVVRLYQDWLLFHDFGSPTSGEG